jgi:hypothetical protein
MAGPQAKSRTPYSLGKRAQLQCYTSLRLEDLAGSAYLLYPSSGPIRVWFTRKEDIAPVHLLIMSLQRPPLSTPP